MRYISCKLDDLKKIVLPIGYEGENEHTRVQVDAGEVFKEYPAAVPSLKVHGPGGTIYPAEVTRDGKNVIWDIKASDCAADGSGEAQFTFTLNNVIVKSCIAKIKVYRSIVGGSTPPDPVQDWLDEAQDVLDDLEAAEVHQPMIGVDGYWYTWNQETGEYEKTETKAQGEDGQQGPAGQDGAPGQDATPALITVNYSDLTFPVAEGTNCYHDGLLYYAKQAIQTSEAWTAAHWQQTTVEEQQRLLLNHIDGMKAKNESVNLYTPQSIENIMDGYTLRNGVPQTQYGAYCYVSDYVPVRAGDSITFSVAPWGTASTTFRGAEYNANKEFIQNVNDTEHTLSENAAYIRFTVSKNAYGSTVSAALTYMNEHLVISNGGYAPVDMSEGVFLVEDTVRKTDTYFVDASGSEMLILSKMAGVDGKDLGIKLKKFSNNDTYQFCSFGTVSNPSQFVSNKPTEYVEFMATAEDWFSPCKVYAVDNADGDYPTAKNFSGGFHKIDGINTSRLVSLDIYFDGRKQDDFVGYCNTIDIVVVHNLTASNTFKSDGTGREVIRETIKIHFENGKVDVTTEFKALEDVTMSVWYFLQAHHKANGFGTNGIRYIGSDANRSINSMDEASNSGDKYCRTMRLLSSAMQVDMFIDDFDAGRFSKCSQSHSAFVSFYTSYSKAYFNVVNNTTTPVELNTGDSITARGSYRFGIFE